MRDECMARTFPFSLHAFHCIGTTFIAVGMKLSVLGNVLHFFVNLRGSILLLLLAQHFPHFFRRHSADLLSQTSNGFNLSRLALLLVQARDQPCDSRIFKETLQREFAFKRLIDSEHHLRRRQRIAAQLAVVPSLHNAE